MSGRNGRDWRQGVLDVSRATILWMCAADNHEYFVNRNTQNCIKVLICRKIWPPSEQFDRKFLIFATITNLKEDCLCQLWMNWKKRVGRSTLIRLSQVTPSSCHLFGTPDTFGGPTPKMKKRYARLKRNSSSANRKNFLFARYEGRFAKNLVAIKII